MRYHSRLMLLSLLALLLGTFLTACDSDGTSSKFSDKTPLKPEYLGLANHSVAVVVIADDKTLYASPDAPRSLCQSVSSALVAALPGIRPTEPRQIEQFQRLNPYWETLPPGDLLQHLRVERLILIDVTNFSTHEPGNANVWQGTIVANVAVAEAEAKNPNNFVYRTNISAAYPEKSTLGVLNSDDQTIRLAMLQTFTRNLLARFVEPKE